MMKIPVFLLILFLGFMVVSDTLGQSGGAAISNPFAQAKFMPDISLILDASSAYRNQADNHFMNLTLAGFSTRSNSIYEFESMNPSRGFNLNYGEMVLYSVVDPYFDLFVVCHLGEDHFDIEEAYFTTRRLPRGLQLKGGKFLSHFGRLNSQHSHQWDFSDSPLPHAAFFGESLLNEKGLRVTWVAPLDYYLMFGGEVLQGQNPLSYGTDGFAVPYGVTRVQENDGNLLSVAYLKTSFDCENLTFLGGTSFAHGRTKSNDRIEQAFSTSSAYSGTTNIIGLDATLKYLFDSVHYLTFQSEFLYRTTDGDCYAWGYAAMMRKSAWQRHQSGFYSQLVARTSKRFRAGIRYDAIIQNDVCIDSQNQNYPKYLPRYSAMVEYNPTEFSRIRLQYNRDLSKYEPSGLMFVHRPIHELFLQINLAIGAHGAHAF